MEITIKINLDNAAFEKNGNDIELSRILEKFAKTCYFADLQPDYGRLFDMNGNLVGNWELTA